MDGEVNNRTARITQDVKRDNTRRTQTDAQGRTTRDGQHETDNTRQTHKVEQHETDNTRQTHKVEQHETDAGDGHKEGGEAKRRERVNR